MDNNGAKPQSENNPAECEAAMLQAKTGRRPKREIAKDNVQ